MADPNFTPEYRDEEDDPSIESLGGFNRGDKVEVIEDDEMQGVFAGDEGFICGIQKVGAEQYGNVRTVLTVKFEGMDPVEVSPHNMEAID